MTQSCDEGLVIALEFELSICLQLTRSHCLMFDLEIEADFSNRLATNCRPLSVKQNNGMPYGITQLSNIMYATYEISVFVAGIAHVSYEQRSVMITTNWFPFSDRGRGPRMSATITFSRAVGGKSGRWRWCFITTPLLEHS